MRIKDTRLAVCIQSSGRVVAFYGKYFVGINYAIISLGICCLYFAVYGKGSVIGCAFNCTRKVFPRCRIFYVRLVKLHRYGFRFLYVGKRCCSAGTGGRCKRTRRNRPACNFPVFCIGSPGKGYRTPVRNRNGTAWYGSACIGLNRSVSARYAECYGVLFRNLIINRFYRRCSKACAVRVILQLVLFFTGAV